MASGTITVTEFPPPGFPIPLPKAKFAQLDVEGYDPGDELAIQLIGWFEGHKGSYTAPNISGKILADENGKFTHGWLFPVECVEFEAHVASDVLTVNS